MRSLLRFSTLFLMIVLSVSCGQAPQEELTEEDASKKLQVVASFSILSDMVEEIGGDLVEVHNLVPIGTDPHEFNPLPIDLEKTADADLVFYNGLNLEDGDGWFSSLIENVDLAEEQVILTTKGVEPKYLSADGKSEQEVNPHSFLNPKVGMIMAENILESLVAAKPENEGCFLANFRRYFHELGRIDAEYSEKLAELPEENRFLVTSEHAFQYLVDEYDLKAAYLWAIDTDEQGTPQQIISLIEFIRKNDIKALFVESNVDPRPLETVSSETGVPIAATVFSDELGRPGSTGASYLQLLEHNLQVIHENLQ